MFNYYASPPHTGNEYQAKPLYLCDAPSMSNGATIGFFVCVCGDNILVLQVYRVLYDGVGPRLQWCLVVIIAPVSFDLVDLWLAFSLV